MRSETEAPYASRRARVLEILGDAAALILPAAPEPGVGRDLELRYQPDPELYYLTGCTEPEAVAVLCPAHEEAPFTLFVRQRDAEAERWTGTRHGPERAKEVFGADAAFPLSELENRLPAMLQRVNTVYFRLGTGREEVERLVREILARARKGRQRSGRGPQALVDPGKLLDELRLIKDEHELGLLREAARITVAGFREAVRAIRPGTGEWQVEAALEGAFRWQGADGPAFPSIVGSGPNAVVLHYVANSRRLAAGELLLVDAGARYRLYHGDVSRTFPVSGTFSPAQRSMYDAVLAARDAAITAVRPGATIADVHRAAVRVLVEALVEHGLLEGEVDALVEREEGYKPYFPHRTSHWLGLEVHDVGDYAVDDVPRPLRPGMVLTVEPGLYIPADCEAARPELRGVGIRIEDDVLVTETGSEVLTAELPVTAEAVEALVQGR